MQQTTFLKKYLIDIRPERILQNCTINPDGFSAIIFDNVGSSTVEIMGVIEIKPGESHEFNFDVMDQINSPFSINFLPSEEDEVEDKIIVTKIYRSL